MNHDRDPTAVPIPSARSCLSMNVSKWSWTMLSWMGGKCARHRAWNRIACRPSRSAMRVTVVLAQWFDRAICRW